jgi:hypothetical protein
VYMAYRLYRTDALAANRRDAAGDVARTAGKAANVAIRKVKRFDERYQVTERVKDVVKEGYQKVKSAVEDLDD